MVMSTFIMVNNSLSTGKTFINQILVDYANAKMRVEQGLISEDSVIWPEWSEEYARKKIKETHGKVTSMFSGYRPQG